MTLDVIDMLLNSDLPYQHKLRSVYELCNKHVNYPLPEGRGL